MKKYIFFLLSSMFIFSHTHAQNFSLDTEKSSLQWTGKAAFNAYSLTGTLSASQGSLMIQSDSMQVANVTVDMKSLKAEIPDLEKHLRSKDFFEVKKFSTATFSLEEKIKLVEGENKVKGNLTIKETTKTMDMIVQCSQESNGWKISGTVSIDRTAFGIVYNSPSFFANMKDQAIADEFELKFEFVFTNQ